MYLALGAADTFVELAKQHNRVLFSLARHLICLFQNQNLALELLHFMVETFSHGSTRRSLNFVSIDAYQDCPLKG